MLVNLLGWQIGFKASDEVKQATSKSCLESVRAAPVIQSQTSSNRGIGSLKIGPEPVRYKTPFTFTIFYVRGMNMLCKHRCLKDSSPPA